MCDQNIYMKNSWSPPQYWDLIGAHQLVWKWMVVFTVNNVCLFVRIFAVMELFVFHYKQWWQVTWHAAGRSVLAIDYHCHFWHYSFQDVDIVLWLDRRGCYRSLSHRLSTIVFTQLRRCARTRRQQYDDMNTWKTWPHLSTDRPSEHNGKNFNVILSCQ